MIQRWQLPIMNPDTVIAQLVDLRGMITPKIAGTTFEGLIFDESSERIHRYIVGVEPILPVKAAVRRALAMKTAANTGKPKGPRK